MKKTTLILAFASVFLFGACSESKSNNAQDSPSEEPNIEAHSEKTERPTGYTIGDEATDFSLENVDGNRVSLSDYADAKGFIITFTCNHCPYAVAYESRIMDLDKKYAPLGYPVIAISPNDPSIVPEDGMEAMKTLATEKAYSFPYLLDAKQEVYIKYGATKTPHMFVLEKINDTQIVQYIGAIDNNYEDANDVSERYVEDAVDALLAGEHVAVTNTKAIGCSIKDNRFAKKKKH